MGVAKKDHTNIHYNTFLPDVNGKYAKIPGFYRGFVNIDRGR